MRIHNLYTDASGQSHFRDIEVEWAEETKAGKPVTVSTTAPYGCSVKYKNPD